MVLGLRERAIPATVIGQMTTQRARVLVYPDGRLEQVEQLDRDELYRILEGKL